MSTSQSSRLDDHVSTCAACQRERTVQSFVHTELRRELTRFHAPATLHRRIRADLQARSGESRPWWRRLSWAMLTPAAGMAFAVLFCANVVILASAPSKEDRLADEVLTSHVRALVASHAIDVVSSDRHTVKPWYTGKLDFSPAVRDFVADGFKLMGGRLDYVDGRTVAALVYEHGGHVVDVFIWPATDAATARPSGLERRGYNLVHVNHAGMTYWLASDLESTELDRLEGLITGTNAM
ncbi:MAG TPA: anti-sigma factor [Usitatibacter sp.]|nr:anti-sigma factor [Usitatibacter sp.]